MKKKYDIELTTDNVKMIRMNKDDQSYAKSDSFADDLTATVITKNVEQGKIIMTVLQDLYIDYFAEVGLKGDKIRSK